ncbi:cell division protein FtsA [Candidatus Peregrinibacteria bacterium]|jgi:cell division protein FtsA|nr:cell division protein FtsA [Candidatus Peregrinibacteria bacterium]
MAKDIVIVGLDIGAHKIRTVVSILDEEKQKAHIIGMGTASSFGIRKGMVVDVNEVIANITLSLGEAERMAGVPIYSAFVSVGGAHLESFNSKGVVAVNGEEISEYDVERVLEAAQALSMPQNKRILRVIPKEYYLDGAEGIKNPVGMVGTRLEAEAHIITGQSQSVMNLEKCVHQAGIDITDLVPSSLAVAESILSRRQKELGVMAVDIGSSTTTLTVFEEGVVLHTSVLPIGGESVTNDIAIGLRTSIDTAEKIKIEYGSSIPDEVNEREMIDLSLISKIDTQKVSKKQLAEIIQARYLEVFHMLKDELKLINRDGMLPAGVVLSGASIKMPGVVDMARDKLGLPAQIGFPQNITSVVEKIDDPSYATVVGLVNWGINHEPQGGGMGFDFQLGKMFSGVGKWFRNLLP